MSFARFTIDLYWLQELLRFNEHNINILHIEQIDSCNVLIHIESDYIPDGDVTPIYIKMDDEWVLTDIKSMAKT